MYLTNSPIVIPSDYKYYVVRKISIDTAFIALDEQSFESAIGHQGTVDVLRAIFPALASRIVLNRIEIKEPSDQIVFKLKGRLPEGKILTKTEIEQIGFEFWSVSVFDKKKDKSLIEILKSSTDTDINDALKKLADDRKLFRELNSLETRDDKSSRWY